MKLFALHRERASFIEVQGAVTCLGPTPIVHRVIVRGRYRIDQSPTNPGVLHCITHRHSTELHGERILVAGPGAHQPRGCRNDRLGVEQCCADVHGGGLVVAVVCGITRRCAAAQHVEANGRASSSEIWRTMKLDEVMELSLVATGGRVDR